MTLYLNDLPPPSRFERLLWRARLWWNRLFLDEIEIDQRHVHRPQDQDAWGER